MALAYTAPTWTNGSGEGISASNLQAMSNCIEGLVQGSDKAITNIAISGQTITLTFADGSEETGTASGLKGISSIAKTGTSGKVDTYTIIYTDGSTSTFTVTNGADGSFYIVTAGIKSTDDPYGNIEYYIGGDFYKNGVLYNQSAFYKVTLVDETEYPPSPYLIDGSSGTFTNGHYSTGSIGGIPSGATITTQIFTDNTMATLLGEVKVLIGLQGSEGEQGPQGPAGDDGVSPEVTITTITGGHRVNITDAEHPGGQSFDVMDGTNTVVPNPQGTSVGDLTSIGINGDKYEIQGGGTDENAYHIGDTAETTLADDDYFPFYDTSASATRKTLWSNIKSVLSNLFAKKTDIAPIENGTTASKAYAVGQQFYLSDGKLYKCKQPIAQGATFTIGTNCFASDCITDQINNLNPNRVLFGTVQNVGLTDTLYTVTNSNNIDWRKYNYMELIICNSASDNNLYTFGNYTVPLFDLIQKYNLVASRTAADKADFYYQLANDGIFNFYIRPYDASNNELKIHMMRVKDTTAQFTVYIYLRK